LKMLSAVMLLAGFKHQQNGSIKNEKDCGFDGTGSQYDARRV
jgi:hypothetical protein